MPRAVKKPAEVVDLGIAGGARRITTSRARAELHEAHKLIFARDISQERRRRM